MKKISPLSLAEEITLADVENYEYDIKNQIRYPLPSKPDKSTNTENLGSKRKIASATLSSTTTYYKTYTGTQTDIDTDPDPLIPPNFPGPLHPG